MAKFVFERFTYLRKLMPKNTTAEFKCALTFLILSTFLKLRIQYSKVLLDSPNMSKIRYFWYKKAHFIICGLVRKIPKSKLRVQIFFRADKGPQREIIWECTKIYQNRSFRQRTFLEVVKILWPFEKIFRLKISRFELLKFIPFLQAKQDPRKLQSIVLRRLMAEW